VSYSFKPHRGSVELVAEVSGPLGKVELRLLLDTGATHSLVSENLLAYVGYDPTSSTDLVKVAMGNGVEIVPRIVVNRFTALGMHRIGFPLLARALPPEAGVDGLLGLDFLRGHVLTLDFQGGLLTLA
jgi:predicted aspartyl protease